MKQLILILLMAFGIWIAYTAPSRKDKSAIITHNVGEYVNWLDHQRGIDTQHEKDSLNKRIFE